MKSHKVLFLALLVSASLAVSAEAGDRHGNNGRSQVAPSRGRPSGSSFSSGSGLRYGGNRTIGSSPHFSSVGVRSLPSQRQFTPRTFNGSNTVARFQNSGNLGTSRNFNRIGTANRFARFQGNGNLGTNQVAGGNRFSNNNRGFNRAGAGNHVFAQRSADWHRDWDRRSDHWWNGHRCRWVNNSWFIFDFGFVPWYGWSYYDAYPYDYYPYGYGGYGYGNYGYDPGAYDQSGYYDQGGYNYNAQPNYNGQSNYYDQGNSNSYDQRDPKSYDQGANALGPNEQAAATVADVQDQLKRAGYYHGKIDGALGPETRHALLRYQSNKGLRMTGSLTTETQQSLGLAAQGADQITDQ